MLFFIILVKLFNNNKIKMTKKKFLCLIKILEKNMIEQIEN